MGEQDRGTGIEGARNATRAREMPTAEPPGRNAGFTAGVVDLGACIETGSGEAQ